MSTLEQCLESLAVCHGQAEPFWAAARAVAQQDIDAYLRDAGSELADKHRALNLLASEFASKFPGESDPVLIRSYIRRQMRRIGYELQHKAELVEETEAVLQTDNSPATVPSEENGGTVAAGSVPMTEQQRRDIARLCHDANLPDRSEQQLSAKEAAQVINELREKAAELLRK
jgi:hypothetical protein